MFELSEKINVMKLFSNFDAACDYDALIATECADCFIRVTGYTEDEEVMRSQWGKVFVSLLSGHGSYWKSSFRLRIKRAWKIFRHGYDYEIEILSRNVLENLIICLNECKEKVYGQQTKSES